MKNKYPMFKVNVAPAAALKNIRKVFESGFVNEGRQVTEFGQKLAKFMGNEKIVLMNGCTSALTLALKISGVGPDTEVVTTSMTCVATNTSIHNLGAKVVWADIDPNTGNIDVGDVAKKITPKTRAVICVNWAGLPCELEKLQKLCSSRDVKLIQDAAHGFGSLYKGKDVSHFTDFTCFSFQAIKHISTGDGGLIAVRDPQDLARAKKLKWFGIDREATKDANGEWKGLRWGVDVEEAGYKFNMNNISAAIGLSQIPRIKPTLARHRKNAAIFAAAFKNIPYIKLLSYPKGSTPSFWVYTLLTNPNPEHKNWKSYRDKIMAELNTEGIAAGVVHTPNHYYSCFKKEYTELPQTDYFANHQISLPCGWWLSPADTRHIAQRFIEVAQKHYKNWQTDNK